MQPVLWIIQYFYCFRQLYLVLAQKLCVIGFTLCNEINAVAKLSRGINNILRDQESKFPTILRWRIKIWGKKWDQLWNNIPRYDPGMRRATRQFRWTKILGASCVNYHFYVTSNCMRRATRQFRWTKIFSASCVNDYYFYVTSNCMRRATRQFRWTKILSASCVNDYYFYVTSNCMRRATRQFRWTKILSASCVNDYYFYVTSNCMRRATRQFRWTKILSASCVNDYYFCYIELYQACRPPAQMDQNIKCKLAAWFIAL